MTRQQVLNKLRDMGIAPIAQSVLSDFTEIANWAAAAERERCAALCDAYGMPDGTSETAMALAEAIRRMK